MGNCGRCRIMPTPPNQAWCADCTENDTPGLYILGTHAANLDPAEIRERAPQIGCTCPAGKAHDNTCPVMW